MVPAEERKEKKEEKGNEIYLQLSYYFQVLNNKIGSSKGPGGTQPHPQDKESSPAAYQYTQILRP